MNFFMRNTTGVYAEHSSTPVPEPRVETHHRSASVGSPLEAFVSDDPFACYDGLNSRHDLSVVIDKHLDVVEEEGWITILCDELPDNWNYAPDIQSLCSLDRSFIFPGEQVHILACLSACKHDTQIIPPFEVAAVTSKNGMSHNLRKENRNVGNINNSLFGEGGQDTNGEYELENVFHDKSLLQVEVLKKQTALVLQNFENSHFFVRISESNMPLWSKRSSIEEFSNSYANNGKAETNKFKETALSSTSTVIDRGHFDASVSGGVARNSVKCHALPNGDIVVHLQVNVGVSSVVDPCIEILQFEKRQERMMFPDKVDAVHMNLDSCAELLNWILPLDNVKRATYPLSPPHLTSNSGIGSTSQMSNFSTSPSSQLSSFGNFRSYSMSSLPQTTSTPSTPITVASPKPNVDPENWDQIPSYKFLWRKNRVEELLSFRGVLLERDRFSACCGLKGIYTPGKRWRRKLEIIQPIDIHSFATHLNSEDLLCVQIKNAAPAHAPDIVMYIDTITINYEESTKNRTLSSLPISCIEAGNGHSLPNLALRRGEEHSFILKPATSAWKGLKVRDGRSSQLSKLKIGNKTSKINLDRWKNALINNQYSIMVTCRSNYSTSRLSFKHPTSWRPRSSRDIMISVASEMSRQSPGAYGKTYELPIQILTLQASNLTHENLTFTVLAPTSFPLPFSPKTPTGPFIGSTEFLGRANDERGIGSSQGQSFISVVKENEKHSNDGKLQVASLSDDVIPSSSLNYTHLWLQSRVPLGCIPSQSNSTVKVELLPLTDGVIVLDSLQIDVKEKGVSYIPECPLKINATSNIS